MRGKRLMVGAIFAIVSSLTLQFLPSGAGQHFGIAAGDYVGFGGTGGGSLPGETFEVRGVFVSGVGTNVDDSGSVAPASIQGFVQIDTDTGTDLGCLSDLRLPVGFFTDPAMSTARITETIPSAKFPGTVIQISLTFNAVGAPKPDYAIRATQGDPVIVNGRAGIGRAAIVTGSASSGGLGSGRNVNTNGVIARGVQAQIDYDGACPAQGY